MKEKHKKMILLTIQDLKDLGVIGRKKKGRRKKRRVINKINSQQNYQQPDNPSFKSQTFNNSSNLDTENKRLQNEVLSNEVSIRNSGAQNPNQIIQNKAIEDLRQNHEDFRNATINYLTNRFHRNERVQPEQQSRFARVSPHITFADNDINSIDENTTYAGENGNSYLDENDNIDVPGGEGSESFIDEGTNIPEIKSEGTSVYSWDMNYERPPTQNIPDTKSEGTSVFSQVSDETKLKPSFGGSGQKFSPENNIIDDNHTVQSNYTNEFATPAPKLSKIDQLYNDASDLGIDRNQFTPNMVHMRQLIAQQKIINPLQDEYVDEGGVDENVYNGGAMELRKHIKIIKLQREYLDFGGTNQIIINSFDIDKIRRGIKKQKDDKKFGIDSLRNSQSNKINSYLK